jgi:hypothetical protein
VLSIMRLMISSLASRLSSLVSSKKFGISLTDIASPSGTKASSLFPPMTGNNVQQPNQVVLALLAVSDENTGGNNYFAAAEFDSEAQGAELKNWKCAQTVEDKRAEDNPESVLESNVDGDKGMSLLGADVCTGGML